ncbi:MULTISPECIES: transglutaminase domain-containing protein [unclassified Chryseobacterium]|uniref:transglutaminase domain-containing protein n=1 Tax=unclassified Chryseobacterium TaxID=2593645 RepID=UPI002269C647|nr:MULTISPECIES: transglutaminase domain-containing protein [unclassified Chryseobacterium]
MKTSKQKIFNKKSVLYVLIASALASCTNKSDSYGILNSDRSINYKTAFDFVKKNAILNFHVSNSGNQEQDSKFINDNDITENVELSYDKSKELINSNAISDYSFVNFVLPYKVNFTNDFNWRKNVLKSYELPKTYVLNSEKSVIEASSYLNNRIKSLNIPYSAPFPQEDYWSFSHLLKEKKGSDIALVNLASFINRANGIPVTIDYAPVWGNADGGKAWNALVFDQKKSFAFAGGTDNIGNFDPKKIINSIKDTLNNSYTITKVYRRGFVPDTASVYLKYYKTLSKMGFTSTYSDIDVTDQYAKTIKYNVNGFYNDKTEIALLSVFSFNKWLPIAAISPKHKQMVFDKIGVGALYLVHSPDNYSKKALFYVDKSGKLLFFDKSKTSTITISQTESIATRLKNMAAENRNANNIASLAQNTINSKLENGKVYTLYKLSDSNWEKQETKSVANNKLSFSGQYQDGIYMTAPEKEEKINSKRPFIVAGGKVVFI